MPRDRAARHQAAQIVEIGLAIPLGTDRR